MSKKEYGLIIPSKKKENGIIQTRILNPLINSDDELEQDDDKTLDWVETSLKKSAGNSGQKSLHKRLLREAVEEDSTVFQYDEVYDDMKASQQSEQERKKQLLNKKPKYIDTILKQSEKRKLENERRLERKIQKEREAEGNEFADKESFVTPSYVKKLEELKKADLEEKKLKLLEEMHDVHKHKNFGVFYNHIFKQRIGEKEIKPEPPDLENADNGTEIIPGTSKNNQKQKNYRTQSDLSDDEYQQLSRSLDIKTENKSSDDELNLNNKKEKYNDDKISRSRLRSNSREKKLSSGKKRSRSRSKDRKKHQSKNYRERRSSYSSSGRREKRSDSKEEYVSNSHKTYSKDKSRENYRYSRDHKERSHSLSPSRRKDIPNSTKRSDYENKQKHKSEKTEAHREKKLKKNKESAKEQRGNRQVEEKVGKDNLKENKNESDSMKDKKPIHSISTTLGATDINKMKLEDRIERFMNIFGKRTVGQKYDEAVQRYFQRKAERESNGLM